MHNYPSAWQRRVLWTSATTIAVVALGTVVVWLIYQLGHAIGFLQPVLIPFAIAAVLAFLLDPVIRFIGNKTRLSRTKSVLIVLCFILLLLTLLGVWVLPRLYQSTTRVIRDMPAYTQKAQQRLINLVDASQKQIDRINRLFPGPVPNTPEVAAEPGASPAPQAQERPTPYATAPNPENLLETGDLRGWLQSQLPEIGKRVPQLLNATGHFILRSVGGAFGLFGTLLNVIIIPIYLFFMLTEAPNIARRWSDYVPLRASPFKTEVVSVLTEINGYLVAFFRGQLLVCLIDGVLVGAALAIMGLDFAFFLGLMVVVLTIIPYLGIVLCYIPVILIAIIQYGDWQHPLMVIGVMFTVQNLEGYLIAPKILGESTGLHAMTVIVSVFFWSLILSGPIGAILAVPLTATMKVIARRYIWERQKHTARVVPVADAEPVLEAGGTGALSPGGPLVPKTEAGD